MNCRAIGSIVTAVIGLTCFFAPGILVLMGIQLDVRGNQGVPNWARALFGIPFVLFGFLLAVVSALSEQQRRWRKLALAGMMLIFPAVSLLLAWPAAQIAPTLASGKVFAPGEASYLTRVVFGAASIMFAFGSTVLWWLVLTGRVTYEDIRGMAEE